MLVWVTFINSYHKREKLLIFTKNGTKKYLWDDFPYKNKNKKVQKTASSSGGAKPAPYRYSVDLIFYHKYIPPNMNS